MKRKYYTVETKIGREDEDVTIFKFEADNMALAKDHAQKLSDECTRHGWFMVDVSSVKFIGWEDTE